jgi:hypothetical protein
LGLHFLVVVVGGVLAPRLSWRVRWHGRRPLGCAVANPVGSRLLNDNFGGTLGEGKSQCVRLLQQLCKGPRSVGVGGLHGGGSYERRGLTLVAMLGGAHCCMGRQYPWWRA